MFYLLYIQLQCLYKVKHEKDCRYSESIHVQTSLSSNTDVHLPLISVLWRLIIQESVESTGWDHNINLVLHGQTHSYQVLTYNLWWGTWGETGQNIQYDTIHLALSSCGCLQACRLTGHFQIAVNLIMKARLSAKAFHMKISFVCIWMKTSFHNKNFAPSLAFIMRFKTTWKWPIRIRLWNWT